MSKTISKFAVLSIIFTLALSVNYLFAAWTGPTAPPPGNNTPTPVNVGSVSQQKLGAFIAGGLRSMSDLYVDGNVGIRTLSPSTGGERDLNLDVEGAVGAKYYCDENGNNCITAAALATLIAGGGGGGMAFGAWESKSINTVYSASTDGIVVAFNGQGGGTISGITDGSNPPTVVRAQDTGTSDGEEASVTMPVKKGNYWRINSTDSNPFVWWIPILSF